MMDMVAVVNEFVMVNAGPPSPPLYGATLLPPAPPIPIILPPFTTPKPYGKEPVMFMPPLAVDVE
jgi:hypothetical protein